MTSEVLTDVATAKYRSISSHDRSQTLSPITYIWIKYKQIESLAGIELILLKIENLKTMTRYRYEVFMINSATAWDKIVIPS